jgi:hypothetical protein
MLDRSAPKNRVNLVLYNVMVVWGRIFIDGCLGVFRPAWPSSLWRDRRLAYRTLEDRKAATAASRVVSRALPMSATASLKVKAVATVDTTASATTCLCRKVKIMVVRARTTRAILHREV